MRELRLCLFVFLVNIFTNVIIDTFVLNIKLLDKKITRENSRFFLLNPEAKILGMILSVYCFYKFGCSFHGIILFLFFYTLIIISLIDIKTMVVHDSLIGFLCMLVMVRSAIYVNMHPLTRMIGLYIPILPMFLANFLKKDSFGFGDIRMFAICGFLVGWPNIIIGFIISLIACSIFAIFLICLHKKKLSNYIAFAPFISVGTFISFFYGDKIMGYFLTHFL